MSYDPKKVTAAGDDLNRGVAIISTVWLALQHCETDEDYSRAIDTLYDGILKLTSAERHLGLYHKPIAGAR